MGNPAHLEELLKGVEHWNAWRKEQGAKFRPDFAGADIEQAYLDAKRIRPGEAVPLALADLDRADLNRADIGRANLKGADLTGASLEGAGLQEADLRDTNLAGASLIGAYLEEGIFRSANLTQAKLTGARLCGADFWRALLDGADLTDADARSIIVPAEEEGTLDEVIRTDLSGVFDMTQAQLNSMLGDKETIIPEHLTRPAHWPAFEFETAVDESEEAVRKPPSPVGFTAPVEFETEGEIIDVRHLPTPPEPRQASKTPIDKTRCAEVRAGLIDSFGALAKNLRKYTKEDRSISNRVGPAEALLGYVESLQKALRADPFLPSTFNDYVEIIALGSAEDIQAFEAGDRVAVQQLVTRARRHYACYPALAEMNDPAHAERVGPDFPYTVATLEATLDDIVYSDDGLEIFSDTTRDTVEAEKIAYPPANANPDKSKLARYGAIIGEMAREMGQRAERMRKAADAGASRAIAWVKSYEKVRKAWEAIEPWLGIGGGGGDST